MSTTMPPKARVVQFESCWCDSPSEPHLLVTLAEVNLEHGEAVAISYAWGEYNRTSRTIGHYGDGTPAKIQLGLEWSPKDFIAALADICDSVTYCWFDQFCTFQSKNEITRTLARIPQIYRTFEVIALMPGKLCECHDAGAQQDFSWSFGSTDCPNNLAYGPWFSRLWTRQEFLYASKISVRWIKSGRYQCPGRYRAESMEEARRSCSSKSLLYADQGPRYPRHMLSPAVQLYLKTYINDIITESENWENRGVRTNLRDLFSKAMRDLHNKSALARRSAQWTLEERPDLKDGNMKKSSVAQFLCGGIMKTSKVDNDVLNSSLHRFVRRLYMLRRSHRATSQPRDYVLAVWPDCPGYKVPEEKPGEEPMSLAVLLEDAITQMERNFGHSIAVSIPAGVLGSDDCTGLWRPKRYLDKVRVTMASDVYGMVKRLLFPYKLSSEGCATLLLTTELPQRFLNLAHFRNNELSEETDPFEPLETSRETGAFEPLETSGGITRFETLDDYDNDAFARVLGLFAIYSDVWGATTPGDRMKFFGEIPSSEQFQFLSQDGALKKEIEKPEAKLSYTISEYSKMFSNILDDEVRGFLEDVLRNWNSAALSEVASAVLVPRLSFPLNDMPYLNEVMEFLKEAIDLSLHHVKGRSSGNSVAESKMQLRLQQWRELRKTLPETGDPSQLRPRWYGGKSVDYHDILLHVACIALAVPFHTAKATGLQVMVDRGDKHGTPARIGLARRDFEIGLRDPNTHTIGAFCSEDDISDDYHLGEGLQLPLTGMYEAIEVDHAGNMVPKDNEELDQSRKDGKTRARKRRFKIIGAWIPPRMYPRRSMTAIIQPNIDDDPDLDAETYSCAP